MGVIVKDSNRQPKFLSILFVVAIPVFLITLNVTWVVNDLRFYENGFRNNNISLTTGIGEEDLSVAAQGIRGYFNSFDEPLSIRTKIFGNERELFNSREIIHMRDVKHLIWGVYILGSVAAIYITGNIAVGFLILGPGYGSILCNLTIKGAIATIGLVAVIGITALLVRPTNVSTNPLIIFLKSPVPQSSQKSSSFLFSSRVLQFKLNWVSEPSPMTCR